MIKSETYLGIAGLNYIQDSELAFSTIYVVKREGTQHDKFVSGSNNRTFIADLSLGKIYFPTPFASGGEKVFVLYKTNGSEPVIPPGVCVPVAITATTLPDGVVDSPYSHTIYLTGTAPYVVTVIDKPTWMTVTNSGATILLSGTPTTEQTETLEFSVSNCSGGSSQPFDQDFEVVEAPLTYYISNFSTPGVMITQVIPNPTITNGSFPVGFATTITGVHPAYTESFIVFITGIVFPQTLSLAKNGSVLQSINIPSDNNYTFDPQTFLSTDVIVISLS